MARSLKEFKEIHDPFARSGVKSSTYERELPARTNRFLITSAQNATPVHAKFFKCMQTMCGALKAELLVIPLRYKNPTSTWTGSQENAEHWAPEVTPYLWNAWRTLNRNLVLMANIKTQPTASNPLTGFDAVSSAASGILGHTKVQLKCISTPSNKMAKILTTTGACTLPNYTDSKAGKIGEFHHSLSAVLVELDGPLFHLRHVYYDKRTESVTDHEHQYFINRVGRAPRPLALVMGDTHVDSICPEVAHATFGPGGMIPTLKPKRIVWHDLLDAYSCNPHHHGNPFNAIAKRGKSADDVHAEVQRAIQFVKKHTPAFSESILVNDNHGDMLRRWVIANDWRLDPVNARFYLETALAMVNGTKLTESGTSYPNPFAYWLGKAKIPRVRILGSDESLKVANVELSMHGHAGPNGARGSIRNIRRIGVKSIIGHSHTPGIDEGCTQSGTSTLLRLEYNGGPSSWMNAHTWLQHDGKRQLNFIINGAWRAKK
jgi:hypothetical protein